MPRKFYVILPNTNALRPSPGYLDEASAGAHDAALIASVTRHARAVGHPVAVIGETCRQAVYLCVPAHAERDVDIPQPQVAMVARHRAGRDIISSRAPPSKDRK